MSDITLHAPFAGWLGPLDAVDDPVFAERMMGDGVAIEQIHKLLRVTRRRLGYLEGMPELSAESFRRPPRNGQLALFE